MNHSSTDISSGTVELHGDTVLWHNDDVVFLQFKISDIAVIGEYTNSNGPWFDDWYMTFVSKNGKWGSIPQYAGRIENLIDELCNRFDPVLRERQLANSTEWKSIVSYPNNIRGKELFRLTPSKNYKEPKTFVQKILYSVGLGKFDMSNDIVLSNDVVEELKNYR